MCFVLYISVLLYGTELGNHPAHIGCIDPTCDVLEVVRGNYPGGRGMRDCDVNTCLD